MTDLTLAAAQTILAAALAHCRAGNFKPMGVVVLDARGALKAAAIEDGSALKRSEIAHGKAYGALSLGVGSRALFKRAKDQPFFIAAASHVAGGALVPVPGGVLIRDGSGALLGAVGISGDTSDNDEAAALAGIAAAGLVGEPGEG
ncbi:heme-binding protein [Ancylobacter sp. 6x-1]|uniref:Heme-binding protein n=1 Tax=Ancylobacter crimeensis TaxID=2579147 RepID=A0ABT0D9H7_9HYPH|nr:heme-binding protein [Ancylobacter crimeensis]MCK0196603.1 heme-binding protein [Ancylobacter crimeensis]